MASGSSYREPKEPAPTSAAPATTNIPQRASATGARPTINFREMEPETRIERPVKERRVTTPAPKARVSTALAEPEFEETRPPYRHDPPHPLTRHHRWLPLWLIILGCVVAGAIVLSATGISLRQPSGQYVNYNGQNFSVASYNLWEKSNGPVPSQTPLPKNPGPYSVLGKPTITADFINRVLASYHSPTAGMGQDLYDLGVKYGIDPVYALAFFMHESLFGTTGEARVTMSLGNERCIQDRPCIDQDRGGYAQMKSWPDGFEQWYKLIRNLYVAQWGRVTVDQIIPKYAPNSDGNNEKQYIATLKHEVDAWRAGILRP